MYCVKSRIISFYNLKSAKIRKTVIENLISIVFHNSHQAVGTYLLQVGAQVLHMIVLGVRLKFGLSVWTTTAYELFNINILLNKLADVQDA